MRQAFAACVAFAVLVVVVVIRFGFKDSPPESPARPTIDAASADAPIDDASVIPDAAPAPKKPAPKPTPMPVIPTPGRPGCAQPANPTGCPAAEPNVNRPCDAEGVHCVYGTSCCPPVYVCNGGVFEAWLTHCP
jgi:hypothetical protein